MFQEAKDTSTEDWEQRLELQPGNLPDSAVTNYTPNEWKMCVFFISVKIAQDH